MFDGLHLFKFEQKSSMLRLHSLLFLFSLSLCSHHFAQKGLKKTDNYREGIHIGYRAEIGGFKAYQDIKAYYNSQRPWLAQSLSENLWMHGFDFSLGTQSDFGGASIFTISYSTRKDKVKGELPNGNSFKRSVKISQFNIDIIDAWWTPFHKAGFDFGFGLMPIGLTWVKFGTQLNGEKPEIGPFAKKSFDFTRAFFNMDAYTCFHIDLVRRSSDKNTGIRFQLFYSLGWFSNTNDLILLNRELNPNSFENYRQRTLVQTSHWGLKTLLFL